MGSKVKMSGLFLPRVDSSFCIVPGSTTQRSFVRCSLYNYLIALQVISLNFKVQCFERPVTLSTVCLPFSKRSVSATGSYQLPTSAGALLTHTEDLVLWTEALMTVKGPAVLFSYQGIRIKFMEMFWEFIELLIR